MMRAVAFFPFASASWALLPLVTRSQMTQGPACYGVLLSTIGAGAIGGALGLGWLKARLGPDGAVAVGTFGAAFALVLFAIAHTPFVAMCACVLADASFTAVLGSLHASVQFALPSWVRARGLAVFLTVFFAAMTVGSVVWGRIASLEGVPAAYFAAAAGAILAVPLTWRCKLATPGWRDPEPGVSVRPTSVQP
jgi:predicted MFS family arabinose efflux permease